MSGAHRRSRVRGLARCLAAVFAILAVGGCGMVFRIGRQPDTAQLDTLSRGISTKDDVQKALGPPKGRGRALFPHEQLPRDLWCYYYEEDTLSESQRVFLFVFFDGGRYSGFMWFSSLPQLRRQDLAVPPPKTR